MKVLIIPDVHLKPWIFDMADDVSIDRYDTIVCLGDLVDDFGQKHNVDLYINTLERVLKFDKDHPDMLWCWGNHDYSYMYNYNQSGFSYEMIATVGKYLGKMINQFGDRFKVLHRIDNTIFSHAGLMDSYVYKYFGDKADTANIDDILTEINSFADDRETAYQLWDDEGPLWVRPHKYEDFEMFRPVEFWQVTGHTPTSEPFEAPTVFLDKIYQHFISVDTFSTHRDGTPFGNQKLVIVDTISNTWEYV